MDVGKSIRALRERAKLTQSQFAEIIEVSQQAVQKWESGIVLPDIYKIIKMAKYFDVSLDALLMGNDNRAVEEMKGRTAIKPNYQNMHDWEFYSSNLLVEYTQSMEEGLDVEKYKDLFNAVSILPKDEIKKKFGDVLFEIISTAKKREEYVFDEPSDLENIQKVRRGVEKPIPYDTKKIQDKVHGAWLGRVCGCMLGKTVECIQSPEFERFLKETNNFPLKRYIFSTDLEKIDLDKYSFNFASREYIDKYDGMPADDDTNYLVLAQMIIEKYGKDFTSLDVANTWLNSQRKDAYCTAERVAFCNFIKGYMPPQSAIYKNPYREWIGAQIRGDYFGYINPGNPLLASEMAFRDASISHVKNGIYGEMFVAGMLAIAGVTSGIEQIIVGGLNEIPEKSRLYQAITWVMDEYKSGVSQKDLFNKIHAKYNEKSSHDWCHTISNAVIVVASLLYGGGDFGKSICMAVETGFDTDCNGATVGSVIGMAKGKNAIGKEWTKPINDTLYTTIFGVGKVKIFDCVEKTLEHIKK